LGFLTTALNVANLGTSILGLGLGAKQAFDPDKPDFSPALTQAPEFQLAMGRAIADPESQQFLNLRNAEREAATRRFQAGLEDILLEHKRNRAIGGPGVITTPQRQDENMWRALAMQRVLDDPAARARAALSTAAGASGGNPGVSANVANAEFAVPRSQQAAGISFLGKSIPRALTSADALLPQSSGAPAPSSNSTPTIRFQGNPHQ
jgi:hypothetical protein